MQHGAKLSSEFSTGMNADATLNFLTNDSCHPCLTKTSPESCVQQNDVNGISPNAGCELLEINHHGVCRSRNIHEMANTAHAFKAPAWVFVIVVTNMLDCATDANRFLYPPAGIGIAPKAILRKFAGQ